MEPYELRAAFARSLSIMYGGEVPAYTTLVEVSAQVNADVLAADPAAAQRLGRIDRVTAERHGAIRVGTATELSQVGRLFAAFGMTPVGFYDLRGSQATSLPVVSTAFRPTTTDELARNPFRVFCSVLVTDDRRYFDADLTDQLDAFLARRTLFSPDLLELADRAVAEGGLPAGEGERLVALATEAFSLSSEPIDRSWYDRLQSISGVAADIGGVGSTHINHLTPRVLDIDALYTRMTERGVTMIDEIQGPPAWEGPDLLLRQTSFKALGESRRFRTADGTVTTDDLHVRFGEVEARGIALTAAGRDLYDTLLAAVDQAMLDRPRTEIESAKVAVWRDHLPTTERGLIDAGLGFFTFRPAADVEARRAVDQPPDTLGALLDDGWLIADPIVYEDFLPRSAAGIFASNLDHAGHSDTTREGVDRDQHWLAEAIGAPVADPVELYAAQSEASLRRCAEQLGVGMITANAVDESRGTPR